MAKLLKLILLLLVPLILLITLVSFETGILPYKMYVMKTSSMYPTIPAESLVIVHTNQYHVGQVVTFVEQKSIVTHRLIAINPNGTITTKGDANRSVDPWHVPKSSIIGGVISAPPMLGFLIIYLKNPLGDLSILFGLLFLWQAWLFIKEIDNNQSNLVIN